MAAAATAAGGAAIAFTPHPVAGYVKAKAGTFLYKKFAWPLISRMDGEDAHALSIWATRNRLTPVDRVPDAPELAVNILGKKFSNPIGLAAGCDKQGEAIEGFLAMGFGFVEIGSVAPQPQPGSARPRVFRLLEDEGIINRVGYTSVGADAVAEHVQNARGSSALNGILGINLGKNKNGDFKEDLILGTKKLGPLADYLTLNLSQLNTTPNLRGLLKPAELKQILVAVRAERDASCPAVPLLVKLSPDHDDAQLAAICEAVIASKMDGIILASPAAWRPDPPLQSGNAKEFGGLTGAPIKALTTDLVRKVYVLTGGTVPLIGVGGVASAQDAYDKIRAGASLVQLYSRLAYEGPYVIRTIKTDLLALAQADGFANIEQAVGADLHEHIKTKATTLKQARSSPEPEAAEAEGPQMRQTVGSICVKSLNV